MSWLVDEARGVAGRDRQSVVDAVALVVMPRVFGLSRTVTKTGELLAGDSLEARASLGDIAVRDRAAYGSFAAALVLLVVVVVWL